VNQRAAARDQRLQFNVLSNLSASVWLATVTLFAVPVLYRSLGPEQYAIVGFFLLAFQWVAFLDLGLSPALGRYAAQQNRPGGSLAKLRFLLSRFELVNIGLALLLMGLGAAMLQPGGSLQNQWQLGAVLVDNIGLMLLGTIALRLIANLYRAGLTGLELQGRVSFINSITISLRLGVPILLATFGFLTLFMFFLVQLLVGLLEATILRWQLSRVLGSQQLVVESQEIRRQALLGISIAGLGLLWISSLQIDKLVMSTTLTATQFGHYMLAIQIASAVLLLTAPLQTAVLPRMTAQLAAGENEQTAQTYALSCLLCTAIGLAATAAILVCGEQLVSLIIGTNGNSGTEFGNVSGASVDSVPTDLHLVIAIYVFSNAMVAVMALSYALQNAFGELRWHWLGTVLLAAIQFPLLYTVAQRGDIQLLAQVYLATMLSYVLLWLPRVHSRYLHGGHWRWLRTALLRPLAFGLPVAALALWMSAGQAGVLTKLAQGGIAFLFVASATALSNGAIRQWLYVRMGRSA
jgi:O-antigen/teichoic acid export membrane protein